MGAVEGSFATVPSVSATTMSRIITMIAFFFLAVSFALEASPDAVIPEAEPMRSSAEADSSLVLVGVSEQDREAAMLSAKALEASFAKAVAGVKPHSLSAKAIRVILSKKKIPLPLFMQSICDCKPTTKGGSAAACFVLPIGSRPLCTDIDTVIAGSRKCKYQFTGKTVPKKCRSVAYLAVMLKADQEAVKNEKAAKAVLKKKKQQEKVAKAAEKKDKVTEEKKDKALRKEQEKAAKAKKAKQAKTKELSVKVEKVQKQEVIDKRKAERARIAAAEAESATKAAEVAVRSPTTSTCVDKRAYIPSCKYAPKFGSCSDPFWYRVCQKSCPRKNGDKCGA